MRPQQVIPINFISLGIETSLVEMTVACDQWKLITGIMPNVWPWRYIEDVTQVGDNRCLYNNGRMGCAAPPDSWSAVTPFQSEWVTSWNLNIRCASLICSTFRSCELAFILKLLTTKLTLIFNVIAEAYKSIKLCSQSDIPVRCMFYRKSSDWVGVKWRASQSVSFSCVLGLTVSKNVSPIDGLQYSIARIPLSGDMRQNQLVDSGQLSKSAILQPLWVRGLYSIQRTTKPC